MMSAATAADFKMLAAAAPATGRLPRGTIRIRGTLLIILSTVIKIKCC